MSGGSNHTRTPDWSKPGPGGWELDASHSPPAPTRVLRRHFPPSIRNGYRKVFAEFGGPLETMDVAFLHGKMYRRLVPLVGGDSDAKPPPNVVLWLATRLHPAFRKANALARRTQDESRFLEVIEGWDAGERQWWIDANVALQSVDMPAMSNEELAGHLQALDDHLTAGLERHHVLHGSDLGPIGVLLLEASGWGLDNVAVMEALRGRSPATVEAAHLLGAIAEAVGSAGVPAQTLTSLDDVRSASPDAAEALDAYLDLYGARVVTSYDIEGRTTSELPETTLAIIRSGVDGSMPSPGATPVDEAHVDALRSRVPAADRASFDQMLEDARRAYGLRDDNGPLTSEWPLGLVRHAFLEAGARLLDGGHLAAADDVFELDTPEVQSLLRGQGGPDLAEIDRRKHERTWEATLDAPPALGDVADPPPGWVLPGPLRRMADGVSMVVGLLEPAERVDREALTGVGIGTESYRGRARVAHSPEDVLGTLEPGDVLVAAWTAPTFNAVLAIAGGVVVQEGGLLSHAAVLARELGIPAVIGAAEAMTLISDGDIVEIDPVAGVVTIVG